MFEWIESLVWCVNCIRKDVLKFETQNRNAIKQERTTDALL